ncbi:surface antigen (D15) [Oleiphilus messinensis]|uniref:Translocation and assembly module subunit TamA n=1 Tax=Oleiphilus messinensis TaxID=141451 RepID=A0A1Y0ID34_9GAMM|nr:autotransporter assembly complex family protein [Oleiphilus messinensis]ARU57293.1 surface antigen (D15) [Oleiphilus messinensis]
MKIVKESFLFAIFGILLSLFSSLISAATVVVSISGTESEIQENILAHLGTVDSEELKQSAVLQRRIGAAVEAALQALGYYHSKWSTQIQQDRITVQVDPGEPVIIVESDVRVLGGAQSIAEIRSLVAAAGLKVGTRLKHWEYDQFKRKLADLCAKYGFLDSRFEQSELLIDPETNQATVRLVAETGSRYRFGDVVITGSKMSDKLLGRLIPFSRDQLVENQLIIQLRRNLAKTGYFSHFQVNTHKQPDHRVDVLVGLQDNTSHYFDVGVGYSTDTGPRFKFGWRWPSVTSYGDALQSNFEVSEPKQTVAFAYRVPASDPINQSFDFDTSWQHKNVENTKTQVTSLGVSFNNRRKSNWQHRYSINLDYERYQVDESEIEDVFYLVPGARWTRSEIAEGIDPDSGYFIRFGIEGSHPAIGSDTTFAKGFISARWLTRLWTERWLMLVRGQLGAISADNINEVPISRRFFTGGDQTVRGYEFESIATRDDDGDLVGGRYLNVASAEMSYRFLTSWRAALFFDAGRAYSEQEEPLFTSVGPGIVWLSPVGQIRLDLAFPLKGDDAGNPRIHISMGGGL